MLCPSCVIIIGVILHRRWCCHLGTPPPGTLLDIETSYLVHICTYVPHICDKVWMYEEMMTNDDNVESSLLTSSLLKIHSLYKFCYKLHMLSWRSRWTELCSCCIYEVCWGFTSIYTTSVYHSLHGSIMGCSSRVTRAGMADCECEC